VTRPVKAGVLALAIVGLLVLVAMAARGGHPTIGGHVTSRPVPNAVQDSFITLLAIAYVAVIVAIVVGFFRYRNRWEDPHSRWLANFALVLLLMGIATAVGYYGMTHSHLRHKVANAQAQQADANAQSGARLRPRPAPARAAKFEWPLALAIAGFLLLGGALVYVRGRGPSGRLGDDDTLEAALAATVGSTIEDLRSERDPRRAVIAAYAQMERALAAHGLRRRPAEAPFEYVARVLRDLHVRERAVRTLTGLFEYAKFSPHEIDAAMKDDAIRALVAIRTDLQRAEELAA
jgi:Domain of unknown function (DUF4129)